MKILFTRFPYESAYGGAEVQTISLMKGLIKKGHAVAFLGSCPVLLKLCREEGIPTAELRIGKPPVSKWSVLSFTWRRKRMQQKLEAALAEFADIDAVCMLSLSEKILLSATAIKQGKKVFWIEHDRIGRWLTKNPWLNDLCALSRNVTTICVSDLSRDYYLMLGWNEARTVSIPNGVAASDFEYTAKSNGNVLLIGCIARLSKDKGVDVLLQALRALPSLYANILGRGNDARKLRRTAFTLGVKDRVSFVEYTEDIDIFYKDIDMFILPSREHDPFGLVAAEAMMRGIPTLVTNQCGIARHIKANEDAIVVKAGSVEALVQGMRILSDKEMRTRIGKTGRQTAQKLFSLQTMIDRYEQLLS